MGATKIKTLDAGTSQGQDDDTAGQAYNFFDYKGFTAKSKQLFLEYPADTRTVENILWSEINDQRGPDVADGLTAQLLKHHPENQSWRKQAIELVQQERQERRERREINRRSGGKVVFLVDRLKQAKQARRVAIIESCYQPPEERRKTLAASGVKMVKADRQYWSDYSKLAKSIKKDWKHPDPESAPDLEKRPLIDFCLSGRDFMAVKYDKPRELINNVIKEKSICMVHGGRGIGKTHFITSLAVSLAAGKPFFAYEVPEARQTLVIDAEMTAESLQTRYLVHSGGTLPEKLDILCSEALWLDDEPLNLAHDDSRERINALLEDLEKMGRKPDLVILDNKSALIAGMDENDNSALDGFLRWLIQLRHKGHAVLLVHHQGKGGQQRGASRLEDPMDTVISLDPVKTEETARGARFTITFTKCRGERPNPDKLTVELVPGEHGDSVEWIMDRQQAAPAYVRALAFIRDNRPETQTAMVTGLELTGGRISTMIKEAREKGYLEKGELRLTKKGLVNVARYYPETAF